MTYPDTATLAQEIDEAFPFVDMPPIAELIARDCTDCEYLAEELERYKGRDINGDAIRLVHQELSHLSAEGWRWILPHYLRFCLTAEAEYNRMETEFLIYNLGPDLEFQTDTTQRLSLLTTDQISCLIDFLAWCQNQEYWKEYCPDNINKAIGFLRTLLLTRSRASLMARP
jgi:hypothetical protein